jgi:hypothetical protein
MGILNVQMRGCANVQMKNVKTKENDVQMMGVQILNVQIQMCELRKLML